MKTLISEAEKIMKKLEKEGKVEILDSEEYMKIFDEIDKEMEDVHRDYIIKSHQSWIEAGKVILYQNSNQFLVFFQNFSKNFHSYKTAKSI